MASVSPNALGALFMSAVVVSCGSSADGETVATPHLAASSSTSGSVETAEPQGTLYGYVDGGFTSTDEWAYEFMFESFAPEQIVRSSSAIVIADVVNIEPHNRPRHR